MVNALEVNPRREQALALIGDFTRPVSELRQRLLVHSPVRERNRGRIALL